MNIEKIVKVLKRCNKRKNSITMGIVVAFLLGSNLSYGEITVKYEDEKINFYRNGSLITDEEELKELGNVTSNDEGFIWEISSETIINEQINIDSSNWNGKKFTIINNGIISTGENGINSESNSNSIIGEVTNNGFISAESNGINSFSNAIVSGTSSIGEVTNNGFISAKSDGINSSSNVTDGNVTSTIGEVTNNGVISAKSNGISLSSTTYSMSVASTIGEVTNNGIISAGANGINLYSYTDNGPTSAIIEKIINSGIIMGKDTAIKLNAQNDVRLNSYNNYGIIAGANLIQTSKINTKENFNSLTDIEKLEISADKGIAIKFLDDNGTVGTVYSGKGGEHEINSSFKYIVNSLEENQNGYDKNIAENTVIKSSELADKIKIDDYKKEGYKNLILNGVDKTLVVDKDIKISDSTINAYKTAVHIESGKTFSGENITFNGGGIDGETAVITGDNGNNNLILSGKTQLNGDIDLGKGNDKIFFEKSTKKEGGTSENNVNLFHKISGAEEIVFNTNVTLFETAKVNGAENIYIGENANLNLRVDATKTDNSKIIGHALYGQDGTTISSTENGTLNIYYIGGQNNSIISFGNNKLENINIDFTNPLFDVAGNTTNGTTEITVKIGEDLGGVIGNPSETDIPDTSISEENRIEVDIALYNKLNKIYKSMYSIDGLLGTEFANLTDDTTGEFVKYLHDIYAGNPYAYSSELSRKTMGMMRNLADKDLNPELNKWAIYGGFTHVDGGTEESYYGKGYYTYDIGSRDIEADTKITGGYFKAEYGKSENMTTGIIFGGNNSQTEILNSKVEGDSFYFGAYAKKFINDFRFTLGAGFQHGDYKADRTAIGYEGITTTRSYDDNYHDRGFDIYGNVKYSKEIGNNLYFEPSFTLSYTYIDQDGANEGNETLAMETDSKYFDYSSTEINLDVRKEFVMNKLTHSLTAGISYERMLSGYDEEYITGRFKNGNDFDILVPEKEKDIFALNTKYELETEKGFMFDVKASYRFENSNDKSEWTLGAGAGYKF